MSVFCLCYFTITKVISPNVKKNNILKCFFLVSPNLLCKYQPKKHKNKVTAYEMYIFNSNLLINKKENDRLINKNINVNSEILKSKKVYFFFLTNLYDEFKILKLKNKKHIISNKL